MFGIANQLLAAVALCVATTIVINSGKARYAWVTILPLSFVSTTTLVAGFKSITDIFWPLAQKPETSIQGIINTSLTAIIMFAAVVIMIDSIRRWLGPKPSTDYADSRGSLIGRLWSAPTCGALYFLPRRLQVTALKERPTHDCL